MRKLSLSFITYLVVILTFVIDDLNQHSTVSANILFSTIQQGAPLTSSQLEELLNVPTPDSAVAIIIQQRGIAFPVTEKILARLKRLNAGPKTIQTLKTIQASRKREANNRINKDAGNTKTIPTIADSTPDPNTITILVATFVGPDPQDYLVTDKIIQGLRTAASEYPGEISIQPLVEIITEQRGGSEVARGIGMKRRANIVLWGYYGATSEKVDVSVYFEVVRAPKSFHLRRNFETQTSPITELKEFKVQTRLSQRMTYLALLTIGLARFESGDYEGAIDRFTKALAQPEVPDQIIDPADLYFYRGLAYYGANRIDQAIADYDRLIKLKPAFAHRVTQIKDDFAAAYFNRGIFYLVKSEYDLAIADFDQVIKLDPNFAGAYNNRGEAYRNKGLYDLAIADFDKAIKLDPDHAKAYNNRGNAYDEINQRDRAIADYNKAIQLNPDYALAYYNRALAYRNMGEPDRAIADYNKAIEIQPDHVESYVNRGSIYRDMKQYDRAIADYDRAIKLRPKDATPYVNRGIAYYETSQYERAIADYNEAIKLEPENALDYYLRALAYQEKGEVEQAISDLKRVLRITTDPHLRQLAEQRLQQLGVR